MSFGKMTGFAEIIEVIRVKDDEGFTTETETVVAQVRCYREGRHGSQRWANLASFSDATDLFRIRKIPGTDITTKHFLKYNGDRFDIISVENVKGRNMYVEILAKRTVSALG